MDAARERWPNERRSSGPNQRELLRLCEDFRDIGVTVALQRIRTKPEPNRRAMYCMRDACIPYAWTTCYTSRFNVVVISNGLVLFVGMCKGGTNQKSKQSARANCTCAAVSSLFAQSSYDLRSPDIAIERSESVPRAMSTMTSCPTNARQKGKSI